MKKLFVFISLLCISIFASQAVQAVSADEKIISFDSQITITKQNKAEITETIKYDLGSTPHHGIYRDIPIDYHDGKDNYYITAKYIGTTDGKGNTVQAETSESGGNYRIRLGDSNDDSLTGVHNYIIKYELSPIITKKASKPFLNIDAIGTGWAVPIEKATTEIKTSDKSELSNVTCFYGSQGSTTQCVDIIDGPLSMRRYSASNLTPYQGMTINANLPDGYVDHYLIANQQRPTDWWGIIAGSWWVILIMGGILIAGTIGFLRWWRARARRKKQIVVAQYEPPTSMNSAEIGLLEDDSADTVEVTATVIDLAVRGYLKITQKEKTGLGGIFGGNEYVLTALKPAKDLSTIEATLYKAFFASGSEVKLNDLDKSDMASAVKSFKKLVKSSLEDKGFYDKRGGILQKGNLTDAGAKEWALVDGFKLYLNVVEKDRLAFTDAPKKTPERFNKLLPYAVALGVEKQWAKQFEGIDVSPATRWYTGSNIAMFSAADLASDLSSGFSSAVSSNSSVSSGGGSAGGGFGGGGGGSW